MEGGDLSWDPKNKEELTRWWEGRKSPLRAQHAKGPDLWGILSRICGESCPWASLVLRWWRIHLQWGRPGFDPELGRSSGGGHGNPLQYSCLESPPEQRNPVGSNPQGRKELDMTGQLSTAQHSTVAPREASPPFHREVEVSPPPEYRLSLWLVLIHKYSRGDAGSGEICRLCSGKLATLPLGPSHHAVTSPGRGEDDVVRWASL